MDPISAFIRLFIGDGGPGQNGGLLIGNGGDGLPGQNAATADSSSEPRIRRRRHHGQYRQPRFSRWDGSVN
jgi:hypothetical protein